MSLFYYFLHYYTGGDWLVFYSQYIHQLTYYPYLWSPTNGNGLGQNIAFILGFKMYFAISSKIFSQLLNMPWTVTEKFIFFIPYWIIALSSSYLFGSLVFKNKWQKLIVTIIFCFNTYALMLVSGGQMGFSLGYAFAPLCLYFFFKVIEKKTIFYSISFACTLSILFLLDVRITYLILLAGFLYWVCIIFTSHFSYREIMHSLLPIYILPGCITAILHAFWILPMIVFHQNPVTEVNSVYSSSQSLQYFSFAKFENTLTLLHPNWPENIFGKVYFMRPEFLIVPILAFSSLLFMQKMKKREKEYLLYFSFVGLMSAFLAKGTNDPFGGVYIWLFNHMPGFVMFRDPTKWYLLVALSYAVLIPLSVFAIFTYLKEKRKIMIFNFQFLNKNKLFTLQNIFIFCVVVLLLFLVHPLWLGQLGGTFRPSVVPSDYTKLENFLSQQNSFSRTLWVPTPERFGFFSNLHPEVSASDYFATYDLKKLTRVFKESNTETTLQDAGIKYVIVPDDAFGEIFLTKRKYDNALYQKTVDSLAKVKWLKEVKGFGKIKVFVIAHYKDHFWSAITTPIHYVYNNPTDYTLHVLHGRKNQQIVFSETYDENWELIQGKTIIHSRKYQARFNSFLLPSDGTQTYEVKYAPQIWGNFGLIVSASMTILLVGYFLWYWLFKVKNVKINL